MFWNQFEMVNFDDKSHRDTAILMTGLVVCAGFLLYGAETGLNLVVGTSIISILILLILLGAYANRVEFSALIEMLAIVVIIGVAVFLLGGLVWMMIGMAGGDGQELVLLVTASLIVGGVLAGGPILLLIAVKGLEEYRKGKATPEDIIDAVVDDENGER